MTFHPINPDTAYLINANTGGLYKSTDSGIRFTDTGNVIEPDTVIRIMIEPNHPRTFYFLSDYRGVYKSTDEGRDAQRKSYGLPRNKEFLDIAPLTGGNGLVVLTRSTVYRSLDGAESWQKWTATPRTFDWPIRLFGADATGQHLYVLDSRHFWETTNGGKSWENIAKFITREANARLTDASDPRYRPVFLGTERGVFRLNTPLHCRGGSQTHPPQHIPLAFQTDRSYYICLWHDPDEVTRYGGDCWRRV